VEQSQVADPEATEFDEFVRSARPLLVRALAPTRGDAALDGAAEALAYAWEHWKEVSEMQNPIGYLYRVGQSRTRHRRRLVLPEAKAIGLPDIEPRLIPALLRLPYTQRVAVWLVHGCGWQYAEVAEALDTSTSMIGNHVSRGLTRLRAELKADDND